MRWRDALMTLDYCRNAVDDLSIRDAVGCRTGNLKGAAGVGEPAPLPRGNERMDDPQAGAGSRDSQHYRELASKLRDIARQCRLPGARREILDLASRYEGRANH